MCCRKATIEEAERKECSAQHCLYLHYLNDIAIDGNAEMACYSIRICESAVLSANSSGKSEMCLNDRV